MKFIDAEEFLKQDKEVQKVFIDWWKPSIGDLIYVFKSDCYTHDYIDAIVHVNKESIEGADIYENLDDILPLLTEGQLIQFIEDKVGTIIEISHFDTGYFIATEYRKHEYEGLGHDLLQAYWKVACEIAKEEVNNNAI